MLTKKEKTAVAAASAFVALAILITVPTVLVYFAGGDLPTTSSSAVSPTSTNSDPGKTSSAKSSSKQTSSAKTSSKQTSSAKTSSKSASSKSSSSKAIPHYDAELTLVNPWNKVPSNWKVNLVNLRNGEQVDRRCYPALQRMMDDCRAAGLDPVICSSYRTVATQTRLYNNKVDRVKAAHPEYSDEKAKQAAAKEVAVPGTSEHHLGLAVDIVDNSNWSLDESQEKTKVQKWLMKNSWRYGFILRYPNSKSSVTGIIYEPWHYRYVGTDAAKEIYEKGICLEEYLQDRSTQSKASVSSETSSQSASETPSQSGEPTDSENA